MKAWRITLWSGSVLTVALLLWLATGNRPTDPRTLQGTGGASPLSVPGHMPPPQPRRKTVRPSVPFTAGSRKATAAAFPWLRQGQLDDGRQFIHVDIAALNALQIGSGFEIDVAGTGTLRPALVEAEQRIEDVRRLTGSWWDMDGREHAFGLSLSSDGRYVAGSFDAVQGQKVFEALDGAGWMQNAGDSPAHLEEDALQHP